MLRRALASVQDVDIPARQASLLRAKGRSYLSRLRPARQDLRLRRRCRAECSRPWLCRPCSTQPDRAGIFSCGRRPIYHRGRGRGAFNVSAANLRVVQTMAATGLRRPPLVPFDSIRPGHGAKGRGALRRIGGGIGAGNGGSLRPARPDHVPRRHAGERRGHPGHCGCPASCRAGSPVGDARAKPAPRRQSHGGLYHQG